MSLGNLFNYMKYEFDEESRLFKFECQLCREKYKTQVEIMQCLLWHEWEDFEQKEANFAEGMAHVMAPSRTIRYVANGKKPIKTGSGPIWKYDNYEGIGDYYSQLPYDAIVERKGGGPAVLMHASFSPIPKYKIRKDFTINQLLEMGNWGEN